MMCLPETAAPKAAHGPVCMARGHAAISEPHHPMCAGNAKRARGRKRDRASAAGEGACEALVLSPLAPRDAAAIFEQLPAQARHTAALAHVTHAERLRESPLLRKLIKAATVWELGNGSAVLALPDS